MFFEDKNDDGLILEDPTNPQGNEVLQRELYYPFGLQFRGTAPLTPGVKQPYLYNGKELDDTGLYAYGFRYYDPATGRFTGVDPIADQFAAHSSYHYAYNNPLRFIDLDGRAPDDVIYIGDNGKVSRVERTDDDFNVFIMESTSQVLHLNDKTGIDEEMMYRRGDFEVGDRVFFQISDTELKETISEVSGGFTWIGLAYRSYSEADFTHSHLVENYFGLDDTGNEKSFLEDGAFSTHYKENFHYFRFGDDHRLFNLYDAGNFMWGAWMNDTNNRSSLTTRSASAAKFGSGLNEMFGDSDADSRAIQAGYHYEIKE